MKTKIISIIIVASSLACLPSCAGDDLSEPRTGGMAVNVVFNHPDATRATETAFEDGDRAGLFVNTTDQPLAIAGNTVNNALLTAEGKTWTSARKLYWDKGTYDLTAYYPFIEQVTSVSDLPFAVGIDQSVGADGAESGGYEASDLLFAKLNGVEASDNLINMKFRHIMSKLTVRLVKGPDFEGSVPENATVLIHNTVPDATVDLNAGVATRDTRKPARTIKAMKRGEATYAAIIVPQRLDNKVPLVEVIMNGVSYMFESRFIFKPGVQHIVSLVLDKNPEQLKIEIGGELSNWN